MSRLTQLVQTLAKTPGPVPNLCAAYITIEKGSRDIGYPCGGCDNCALYPQESSTNQLIERYLNE